MLKNCDNYSIQIWSVPKNKFSGTKKHKILTRTTKPHKSNRKQTTRSFGKY